MCKEFRGCLKVEVAVLDSPSLIVLMVFLDVLHSPSLIVLMVFLDIKEY